MHKIIILFFFLIGYQFTFSQELNCQVSVVSPQIQGTTEKQIFEQLQKAIFEFMNNTKWTKDNFTTAERIDCSVLINVTQKLDVVIELFKKTIYFCFFLKLKIFINKCILK